MHRTCPLPGVKQTSPTALRIALTFAGLSFLSSALLRDLFIVQTFDSIVRRDDRHCPIAGRF